MKAAPIIKKAMERVFPLKKEDVYLIAESYKNLELPNIPMAVNVETGDNWEEMFPLVKNKNVLSYSRQRHI